MSRFTLAAAPLVLFGLAVIPAVRGEDKADDARAIAVKVTSAGAAMFDARDAKGLALTYTDDARIEVYSREQGATTLKTETVVGRAEIQAKYEEMFKGSGQIHSRNTIEYARQVDAETIMFSGYFVPNTEDGDPLKLPFNQIRVRQGDAWKIVSLQLFIIPQK